MKDFAHVVHRPLVFDSTPCEDPEVAALAKRAQETAELTEALYRANLKRALDAK